MSNNRDLTFDVAKGIGIFLMVVAHGGDPDYVDKFIFSFHMPLFFIISGIFFNAQKYQSIIKFLKSKFRNLVVPYFSFSVIVGGIYIILGRDILHILCNGWAPVALWFIPVLFFSELLFVLIFKLVQNRNYLRHLLVIIILLSGYFCHLYSIHIPYDVEVVGMGLFFVNLGYSLSACLKKTDTVNYIYIGLGFVLQFVISQYLTKLDMCINDFGSFPWSIILAVWGSYCTILLSKRISLFSEKNWILKFFNWAGKNTLTILGLSQVITILLFDLFLNISMPHYISSIIRYSLLWIFLYLLAYLFEHKLPFIIGKKYDLK